MSAPAAEYRRSDWEDAIDSAMGDMSRDSLRLARVLIRAASAGVARLTWADAGAQMRVCTRAVSRAAAELAALGLIRVEPGRGPGVPSRIELLPILAGAAARRAERETRAVAPPAATAATAEPRGRKPALGPASDPDINHLPPKLRALLAHDRAAADARIADVAQGVAAALTASTRGAGSTP